MSNLNSLREQYLTSAENLEKAKFEFDSVEESESKREFYKLKYMGFTILNELCREFYNLEANPTQKISKLSALSPVILVLFEAYTWYRKEGNKKLRQLAKERGMLPYVDSELKNLKALKASSIESYRPYRDKIAGHFDLERVELLDKLSNLSFDKFEQDAINVIRYGNGWLDILKDVGLQKIS